MRWLLASLFALPGCVLYRTYPLMTMEADEVQDIELSGLAQLPSGHIVAVAEGTADSLWVPNPDVPVRAGDALDLLPLRDGRDACESRKNGKLKRGCAARHFRAEVRLSPQPVRWLERERGVSTPFDVEDIAPYGEDRLIGVTKYSTVGRRTAFRRELIARPRRQTERLFVLERQGNEWVELDLPEVNRLRDSLSDWGRSSCNDDMLVEGIAVNPDSHRVYIGLSRCDGPTLRVLRYDLGAARNGLATTIVVEAAPAPEIEVGPAEGITSLSFANGQLWALSAWDTYGYETQAAFGGRLWRVESGFLTLADVVGDFRDRPSALAVLPPPKGANPDDLDAIVLFDNDAEAGSPWRPNGTVIASPTPAPTNGRWVELLGVEPLEGTLPLGLNGFDLRWFDRDHRLAQMAFSAAKSGGRLGGWTRALGGRWQMEVGGSMGLWTRSLGFGKPAGHNKQAVALTDYSAVPDLTFRRFRVRLSVIPRDRERENPSVAELMENARPAYLTSVPLGIVPSPGAGVILQGFSINTASRAEEGICLAGLDFGTALQSDGTLAVQATMIGGICNDFDTRGPALRHGKISRPQGGVELSLDIAIVEGRTSETWSGSVWDRSRPGPRENESNDAYRIDPARATNDAAARAHLHCGNFGTTADFMPQTRDDGAMPPEWLRLGSATTGTSQGPGSLSGFSLVLDPLGFDPGANRPKLTDAEALARNNYIYRYLVRAFPTSTGVFLEAGLSHGIHRVGLGRDNARPSALLARVDLTRFPGLEGAQAYDVVGGSRHSDPNLLPEDGYPRWASAFPLVAEPVCAPGY